jgi:hypothetical protein
MQKCTTETGVKRPTQVKQLSKYVQVSRKWRTNGALRKREKNVKKILLHLFAYLKFTTKFTKLVSSLDIVSQ